MASLKVTITLAHGMAEPKALFHLDALLCALRVKQARLAHGDHINPREYHYDIPLERYQTASGEWVFKASAFKVVKAMPASYWFQIRRLSIKDMAEHRASGYLALRAAKPAIENSPLKPNFNSSRVNYGSLVAYCEGERSGVEALLKDCEQVGGLRGVGFGRVESIRVEEVAQDACKWSWRALPEDADQNLVSDDHIKCVTALRAPYWDRTMHVAGLSPTQ